MSNFIIILVIIIAIPLLLAAIMKKQYEVKQDIVINRNKNDVFAYIKYLKNQDNFSKWILMDPNVKKEYRGTDATVGFVSTWESENKKVGRGEQEIKNIVEGERIDYEIRFITPFQSVSPAYLAASEIENNQTKVTWSFTGKMAYPMNLMIPNLVSSLEKDLHTGLENLKNLLEK